MLAVAACSDTPTDPELPPRLGSVAVVISQGIQDLSDPDGYTLTVGAESFPVPPAGDSLRFDGLPADSLFQASLSGLASSCWVAQTTRSIVVIADSLRPLRFVVNCARQWGEIRVALHTHGLNLPTTPHRLTWDGTPFAIGINDTLVLHGSPGATTTLKLDVATPGCWPGAAPQRTYTYPPAGQQTTVPFDIPCGTVLIHAFPPGGAAQFFHINVPTGRIRPLATMHTNAQGFRQSPDGTTIAFMAFNMVVGGNVELYLMNPDATGIRTALRTGHDEVWPSWSIDGKTLFFADYDEGDLRRLDLQSGTVTPFPREADEETWPTLRPQGDRLAYDRVIGTFSQVWTMDLNGNDRRPAFSVPWFLATPDWSPDGGTLVVAGVEPSASDRIKILAGVPGSVPVALTSPDAGVSEGSPRWSPDGSRIAFIRILTDGSVRHLMVMRPDGSDLVEVPVPYSWNGDFNWIR